jgi:hypothetical protein
MRCPSVPRAPRSPRDARVAWLGLTLGLASATLVACGEDTVDAPDSGVVADAQATDVGAAVDTGVVDTGVAVMDAAAIDTGAPIDTGVEADGGVDDAGPMGDGGYVPEAYGRWIKFEPPGARCADGSQYKYFVNFVETSTNVVLYFEGGGACWDYASCTGTGIRTAANRDGIPDNHATAYLSVGGIDLPADVVYPLLNADERVSPMARWNKVFVPYCTGDVYSGNTVTTYTPPDGGAPVQFHHEGHTNVMAMIDQLRGILPSIDRMFVSGCSAGGTGSLVSYYFLRTGLAPQRGYLLDDSGPLFPTTSTLTQAWSRPLHDRVRQSWNVDPLLAQVPQSQRLLADFGSLPAVLSELFPNDRLAHTHFRLDYNYSLYSYERFWQTGKGRDIVPFGDQQGLGGLGLDENDPRARTAVYSMWRDDTEAMRSQFGRRPNLGYFMPFWRRTNDSHCVTIPGLEEFPQDQVFNIFISDFPRLAWAGTDLAASSGTINLRGYVDQLLSDGAPMGRYFEATGEGAFLACYPEDAVYDAGMCAAAR